MKKKNRKETIEGGSEDIVVEGSRFVYGYFTEFV